MNVIDTCIKEKKDPHSTSILQRRQEEIVALVRSKMRHAGGTGAVFSSASGAPAFFLRDKQCCVKIRYWDELHHDTVVSEIMVRALAQIHFLNIFVGL